MSYCRTSSDGWNCDLYCYPSCDGTYVTHVACKRIVGDVPEINWFSDDPIERDEAYRKREVFLQNAERQNIGLPCDGQSFVDETLEGLIATVKELKAMGYRVPDRAIERMEKELNDQA